jgi:hypothetical protein
MSFFVLLTDPPRPKTKNIRSVSILLAAVFVIMVVAQLFTYEDFPTALSLVIPSLSGGLMYVAAAGIVIAEVFALPFLLSMRLSRGMRILSMMLGWLVIAKWLAFTILAALEGVEPALLGATIGLPEGWWAVFVVLSLGILTAWTSWGMWPFERQSSAKK